MTDDYVYIGAVGLEIKLTLGSKITVAEVTDVSIVAFKPDSTEVTWPADLVESQVQYITVPGDIDQAGNWKFQSLATTTSGGSFLGKAFKQKIYNRGETPK